LTVKIKMYSNVLLPYTLSIWFSMNVNWLVG